MLAHVQWGVLGTWAAALFTGGALVSSVCLIRTQHNERRDDMERKQATLVSAWPEELGAPITPGDGASLRFSYANRSDEPVYLLEVGAPNRTRADLKPIWTYIGTVAPGFTGQGDARLTLNPEPNRPKDDPGVSSRFRDAAGRWWQRELDGALRKLSQDPRERKLPAIGELPAVVVVESDQPPML